MYLRRFDLTRVSALAVDRILIVLSTEQGSKAKSIGGNQYYNSKALGASSPT